MQSGLFDWTCTTNHQPGNLTNEMTGSSIQSETRKKNQSEQGWLLLRPRSDYISIEKIAIGILDVFDRPIRCNVNITKLWPRITVCWWTRRQWVKSWTNWFKTKSWTYFRTGPLPVTSVWRHFRSKLYYYSSKEKYAGKKPGILRTYFGQGRFRTGPLPVTWLTSFPVRKPH